MANHMAVKQHHHATLTNNKINQIMRKSWTGKVLETAA
jgi:hypothetical protein